MRYVKCETADKTPKTPEALRRQQWDYYHNGGGRDTQKRYREGFSEEKKAMRKEQARAWKARNRVRMTVSRMASGSRHRVAKKNPAVTQYCTWDLLGCDVAELQHYIESQFRDGMSWDNRETWHIDHVKPLCEFDLSNISEVRKCLHYTNLQVLRVGVHDEKAKREATEYMEAMARKWWAENMPCEYPGFKAAWARLSKPASRENMEIYARKWWARNRTSDWPGFRIAWHHLTNLK